MNVETIDIYIFFACKLQFSLPISSFIYFPCEVNFLFACSIFQINGIESFFIENASIFKYLVKFSFPFLSSGSPPEHGFIEDEEAYDVSINVNEIVM